MNHVAMAPTDEQLDRDWQPNGRRPQSTIARSFSQELIDIFRIEDSVSDLGKDSKTAEDAELESKLEQKKQEVTSQSSELEALERRIKEMEERLKRSQGIALPAGQNQADQAAAHDKDSAQQRTMGTSRPGTAKQTQHAPMHGGAMPPTPTASEGEYELVDPLSKSTTSSYMRPDHGVETRSFTDMVLVSKDGGDRDS